MLVYKEINLISNDVLAVILGTIANSIYNIGLVLKKKGANIQYWFGIKEKGSMYVTRH